MPCSFAGDQAHDKVREPRNIVGITSAYSTPVVNFLAQGCAPHFFKQHFCCENPTRLASSLCFLSHSRTAPTFYVLGSTFAASLCDPFLSQPPSLGIPNPALDCICCMSVGPPATAIQCNDLCGTQPQQPLSKHCEFRYRKFVKYRRANIHRSHHAWTDTDRSWLD